MARRSKEKRLDALEDALAPPEGREALREISGPELQFAAMVVSQGGEHTLGVDATEEEIREVATAKLNQRREEMGLSPIEEADDR